MGRTHRHDERVVSESLGSELGQARPVSAEFEVDAALAEIVGVGGVLGQHTQPYAGRLLLDPADRHGSQRCGERVVALDREGAVQLGQVQLSRRVNDGLPCRMMPRRRWSPAF
jgi:hypothetical protein